MVKKEDVLKVGGIEIRAEAVAPGVVLVCANGTIAVNANDIYLPFTKKERDLDARHQRGTAIFTNRKSVIQWVTARPKAGTVQKDTREG